MTRLYYAKLYQYYTSAIARTVRLLYLFFTLSLLVRLLQQHVPPMRAVGFLLLFFMVELFVYGKIKRIPPPVSLADENRTSITDTFSMALLSQYVAAKDMRQFIMVILKEQQIEEFLRRLSIVMADMQIIAVSYDDLWQEAEKIAKENNDTSLTSIAIMSAYLLLTEPTTKLLFSKELHRDDVLAAYQWMISKWQTVENPQPVTIVYHGMGLAEPLIYGWTPETKKYTRSFAVGRYDTGYTIGRETEYEQLCTALTKKERNSVLLVGEVGVGRENLVERLAVDSYNASLLPRLNHMRVLELLIGELTAGAGVAGELEERLDAVIAEVSHAINVVLYIPDFEHVLGSSSFHLDLSGALIPYLRNGEIPIIATMTDAAYKQYLLDTSLQDEFTVIPLKEPAPEDAMRMLFAKSAEIERTTKTFLTYAAVKTAMMYARNYSQDVLPGAAVALLTDTAQDVSVAYQNRKRTDQDVAQSDVQEKIQTTVHIPVAAPTDEERQTLLSLEPLLEKNVIGQDYAIHTISDAIRRIRASSEPRKKPISFLLLGPTGVGKTQTAKALASFYFGGEKNMIRFDMSEFAGPDAIDRLLGNPNEKNSGQLTEAVRETPYSLLLFDEFEKATEQIHNLFLQILDDGRLSDSDGKTMSFTNTIILATSNAGSEYIREHIASGQAIDTFKKDLLDLLQSQGIFRPELLNRFDDIIVYTPLSPETVRKVVVLLLTSLRAKYEDQDITIQWDDKTIDKIANDGANVEYGARPLERYIVDMIESPLADTILRQTVSRGQTVSVTVDERNIFVFSIKNS